MIETSSLALLTDLYQLTMAYACWKNQLQNHEAVFHLFFRRRPFNGGFTIAAGLEGVVDFLKKFCYSPDDLAYLSTLKTPEDAPLFPSAFLTYLADMRFSCDIDAVEEGSVVFPYEPLIRVKGPLIQCQLLETPLLAHINFPTIIATKAARVALAAAGDPVLEFGLRRAQGINGAITASRAAYIGGCTSTSNVLAGKLFGIPVQGTHSHSWVMLFDEEIESFYAFAKALPANCVFLVDTYHTIKGVKKAIKVGEWLRDQGKKMLGIRLDSGDLAYLSKESRRLLDAAGFHDAKIVASNELDENIIRDLKQQGAQIAVWGVGTNLITARDQPALDGVYKLSAIRAPGKEWEDKIKLSEQMTKVSNPGILQVCRFSSNGRQVADMIWDEKKGIPDNPSIIDPLDPTRRQSIDPSWEGENLLKPVFSKGECVYTSPPINIIRERTLSNLKTFDEGIKRFIYPHQYIVGMEKSLYEEKVSLIKKHRQDQ